MKWLLVFVLVHGFFSESHAMNKASRDSACISNFRKVVRVYENNNSTENFEKLKSILLSEQGKALDLINSVVDDRSQETLLHRFAAVGNLFFIKGLLKLKDFTAIDKVNGWGKTALYSSIQMFKDRKTESGEAIVLGIIENLLAHGADATILGLKCFYPSYVVWFAEHVQWVLLLEMFLKYRSWSSEVIEEAYVLAQQKGNSRAMNLLDAYRVKEREIVAVSNVSTHVVSDVDHAKQEPKQDSVQSDDDQERFSPERLIVMLQVLMASNKK